MSEFAFAISDVGLFLGKSPVTIRSWERKGLVKLPRVGNKRSLTISQVRDVARIVHAAGRIPMERLTLIAETLNLLEELQEVNS